MMKQWVATRPFLSVATSRRRALQLDAEAAFDVAVRGFCAGGSLDVFENGVPA